MARRAIILVEAAVGKAVEVMHSLRQLDCVRCAERVTPPYDVIAIIEVDTPIEVTEEIQRRVVMMEGITRVVVCSTEDEERTRFSTPPHDDRMMVPIGHVA